MNTKAELKDYILRKLGSPIVQVEVSDDQLEDIINDTIKEFSEFAYDGELIQYFLIDCAGRGEYSVDSSIQSIQKLSKGSAFFTGNMAKDGFVSDDITKMITNNIGDGIASMLNFSMTTSLIDYYFGDDINYNYNHNKKKLYIFEEYSGPMIIECNTEYVPDAEDEIFNHQWVKAMCIAQARLQQSVVVGKFDASLVSGTRINYADMRSLAQEEIEKLKEDLMLKYAGPSPIFIG